MRPITIATIAAVTLALPALAESTSVKGPVTTAATAARGSLFTEKQARDHLSHLGYTNVSGLTKDESGVWHGFATKDGKTLTVAVAING